MQAGEMDRFESLMRAAWLGWLHDWMRNRFYVDKIYGWVFAKGSVLLATALDSLDSILDGLVNGTAWLGWGSSQFGEAFDAHALDSLVDLAGSVSKLGARASAQIDTHLDSLVDLAGRAGRQLARVCDVLDLRVGRLVNLARPGMLRIVKLSQAMDRGLDIIVSGIGSGVRAGGLWFRPKTGKVQSYLLTASAAVLVLTVVFLFLFL
jgi:hypothetical protein